MLYDKCMAVIKCPEKDSDGHCTYEGDCFYQKTSTQRKEILGKSWEELEEEEA